MLRLPDACRESLQCAKAEMLIEVNRVFVDGGDGERERIVMAAAEGLDRMLHQLAADAVAVIAGHDADLRGVADAFGDRGREDHADKAIAGGWADEEGGFGKELTAAGQQHDIAQEFQAARFAAILVVDLAVDVIGVGELNQTGSSFEGAVVPGLDAQTIGKRFSAQNRVRERQKHELARMKPEMLGEKGGIEFAAERHQLGFDALKARRTAERAEHFAEQRLGDRLLRAARRDEKAADQAFAVFKDVETVAEWEAIIDGGVSTQGAGVDKPSDEVDGGSVVPVELFPPVAGLLLEQTLERP